VGNGGSTLKAVRVDPNGHKVEFTIGNLHTIDVGVDGAVTNCVDGSSLGNLRVEYDEVARFLLIYSREVGRTLDAEGRSAKLDNATRKHNGSKNSGDGEAWEEQAREMALAIVKRQKARDLYPNQVEIADEIAAKFRTNGVLQRCSTARTWSQRREPLMRRRPAT